MKIGIVGSSGYIAGYIFKRLKLEDNIGTILRIGLSGEAEIFLDLLKAEEFDYSVLNDLDYIIFTAAVSSPDKCASEFEYCWSVNVTGTLCFIREAIKRNCRVIFFSSDAVYGGDANTIYNEESITKADTPYGKMKKAVEDAFNGNQLFKAIRLSYVVSAKDRFTSYCINCIRTGAIANVYHPFYRNCITVSDVVTIVIYLLNNWEYYKPSFLNAVGDELVSRVRIADEINRWCSSRLKYLITTPEYAFYKNRSMITQVRSLYLQQYDILYSCSFSEKFYDELRRVEL